MIPPVANLEPANGSYMQTGHETRRRNVALTRAFRLRRARLSSPDGFSAVGNAKAFRYELILRRHVLPRRLTIYTVRKYDVVCELSRTRSCFFSTILRWRTGGYRAKEKEKQKENPCTLVFLSTREILIGSINSGVAPFRYEDNHFN